MRWDLETTKTTFNNNFILRAHLEQAYGKTSGWWFVIAKNAKNPYRIALELFALFAFFAAKCLRGAFDGRPNALYVALDVVLRKRLFVNVRKRADVEL